MVGFGGGFFFLECVCLTAYVGVHSMLVKST